jgi:tetratricopeptide (TPR) repeat protein
MLTAGTAWAEPKLEVSLDRDTIAMGDSAVLTMDFEDCSPGGMPNLPTIANLQYGGQSSEQSFSLVGASMTRKTTYSVELHPTKPGVYNIPPIEADVDGAHLRSRALTLRVAKSDTSPGGAGQVAFVRLVVSTNTIYVGQALSVEVQCFCQDNVGNIQMPQISSDDFVMGDLPNNRQRQRVEVGNMVYNLFSFQTTATAIKAGTYSIGPANWTLTVFSGQRNFFGWSESHQQTFSSDAPEVRVLPVPMAGAPVGFSGALGQFTLDQYEAGPATVNVGDPITLKIRIGGHGAFDTVTLPTNSDGEWREFKTYPPTARFDPSDSSKMDGSKYFEQVITPLNAEVKEIPAFVFSYFDPTVNAYRAISHAPIPLTVNAAAATPQPTVVSTGAPAPQEQPQTDEIVHIKPMLGKVGRVESPLIQRPGFLALQAVAPLAWICALARRKQKEKLANNPRLRRKRQVEELVREGLAELPRLATANDAEKFYSTVLRLLQEQLGERLDLPAPAITEAVVEETKGWRPETATLMRELFHACNQFRYTPEHTSQELVSLIPKTKTALQELQRMPATPTRSTLAQAIGIILLFLGALSLHAEATSDDFTQANRLFEEGKYSQAADAYEKMVQGGTVSPELYFNLGDACFKAGQMGRAISAFRHAELLAPRDQDIRANLQIARNKAGDNNPALPGTRWTRWTGRLSVDEWTVSTFAVVALFFIVLTVRELSQAGKNFASGWIIALAGAGLCLALCLGIAVEQGIVEKSTVVIVPEAVARLGPLREAQSVFTAHDGAELLVQNTDGDWLEVADAANHVGWIDRHEVDLVP